MTKLLKSIFLALGLAGLMTGMAYAKDEPKQTAAKEESKSTAKQSSGASGSATTASTKAAAQVDINSASEKELAALPKIGDVKAKAIVKNRPYRGKDDLVDKKILTQNEYDAIKDQIIAKQKAGTMDKSADKSAAKVTEKPSDKAAADKSSADKAADKKK